MKYDTILFDLDGTLLYTLEDLADSINYMLAKYNEPILTIDQVRNYVGNGLKMLVVRALRQGENYPEFDKFLKEFIAYYNTHNRIKTMPYKGVLETTKKLQSMGIKMAIVTNKGQTASESLLEDYFKPAINIVIGDNGLHKRKPDSEPINLALEALNIKDAKKVLYVGDSEVDAATAENSNLDYVLCTYGFRDMDVLKKYSPVAFIDDISMLLEIIQ